MSPSELEDSNGIILQNGCCSSFKHTLIPITFKIRHTPEYHKGFLEVGSTKEALAEGGSGVIHSQQKIHGVAPGQFCVIYDEQHDRCYGSGEITV